MESNVAVTQDLEFNSYEGKVYGIPVSKEISYIYYNKDLFKKAGLEAPDVAYETWDDFYKACDTLKSKNITPVSMDTADLGWLSNLWYSGLIGTAGEEAKQIHEHNVPNRLHIRLSCKRNRTVTEDVKELHNIRCSRWKV